VLNVFRAYINFLYEELFDKKQRQMIRVNFLLKRSYFPTGPTVGGILFDAVTFRWAIMFIIGLELIAFILLVLFLVMVGQFDKG
jgi:hypothetical protein